LARRSTLFAMHATTGEKSEQGLLRYCAASAGFACGRSGPVRGLPLGVLTTRPGVLPTIATHEIAGGSYDFDPNGEEPGSGAIAHEA
jgi:hypothetical protein